MCAPLAIMKTLFNFKDYTVSIDHYQYIISGPHRTKYTTSINRVFTIIKRFLEADYPNDADSKLTLNRAIRQQKKQNDDFLKEMEQILKKVDLTEFHKDVEKWWEELSFKRSIGR